VAALAFPSPSAARWQLHVLHINVRPTQAKTPFDVCVDPETEDRESTAFKLNLAASILLPCIVPFTFLFIAPVNDKLTAKMHEMDSASLEDTAIEKGVAEGETTHALIDKWATLNVARAVFIAAGALCAAIAAGDKTESVAFGGIGFQSGANRM
jgi:hypothetical protein